MTNRSSLLHLHLARIAEAAVLALAVLLALSDCASAGGNGAPVQAPPANFLFIGHGELSTVRKLLDRPDIQGVQILYTWKMLEPHKGRYDFSSIEHDLHIVQSLHKKLFIQIQDRFFQPQAKHVPSYLLDDPIYGGGLAAQRDNPGMSAPTMGWVAMQWNPHVRARFQKLLEALATRFDGRIYGINLPETAADVSTTDPPPGFTCAKYFRAEMDNMAALRRLFRKTHVVQYVNFWPGEWNNDHHYMSRVFAYASAHGIGLGGPDIVPWRPSQMKNSYPFFHEYRGRLPLAAMAVQGATLTYINPKTHRHFTKTEFVRFARDYLGVDIIFWSVHAPWLDYQQPSAQQQAFLVGVRDSAPGTPS